MLDIFFKDIRVVLKKYIKISSFILILSYNCVFQFWITENDLTKQNNEEM